jgi:hypothetical protein
VAQRLDALRADIDPLDVEELHVRNRAAVHLLKNLVGFRALDLEAVMRAVDRLAVGARHRTRVAVEADLPRADRLLELHPVGGGGAADEDELVLTLAEDDHVADDMAGGRDGHEMLGTVQVEIGEGIDADMVEEGGGVRPLDDQLVHVVRLVEQDRAVAPGLLLGTPVGVFRCNHRVYIHADLGIAQQLDRVAFLGQNVAQA